MATLLGVGEVILAQARAPALRGGGDVVVLGAAGRVGSARHILGNVLGRPPLAGRVAAVSPTARAPLYLVRGEGRVVPIRARGGVPSHERALGDPETAGVAAWKDAPTDSAWTTVAPGDLLRSMDRFHPIPDVPARADSWGEWLYFNGRSGDARFYLTFMVGPKARSGRRLAGVRLQLDRGGTVTSYGEAAEVDEAPVLAAAPDLAIGRSSVRLDGVRYRMKLDLAKIVGARLRSSQRAAGDIVLEAVPGRSLPPLTIRGAGGWLSGYTVPVMSGILSGGVTVEGERLALDGGTGYHDHNWGFWEGVTWQWGQVQHAGLSFVYGRVRPPADAADADRIPGFLAALGPEGPRGHAVDVTIAEEGDPATERPRRIVVQGRGESLDLRMELDVEDAVVTRTTGATFGGEMDFLQLRARYRVAGKVAGQAVEFEAPGSAETFRGRASGVGPPD